MPRTFPCPTVTSKKITRLLTGVGVVACSITALPGVATAAPGIPGLPGMPSASNPVATFDGYGPLRLGMTEEQVVEAMGAGPREESGNCILVGPGENAPVTAFINEKTKHLNGISTPPGTKTGLEVGDGSTVEEVREKYAEYAIDDEPATDGASRRLNIYEGPKEFIAHRMLGFAVHPDGTVGPPAIGRPADWVGC